MTAAVGGRGPLLSGSSAALALLVPVLIGGLVVDPRFVAADGQPILQLLLAFIAFGVILAGVMQVLLAASRLGGLVRYVPYPVHAGYMNGVAVLMVMAMLPHLLGLPLGQSAADWRNAQPLAPVVALVGSGARRAAAAVDAARAGLPDGVVGRHGAASPAGADTARWRARAAVRSTALRMARLRRRYSSVRPSRAMVCWATRCGC